MRSLDRYVLSLILRHHALKNAQKYLKEYNAANRELIAKRRTAKQSNTFYVEAEPRVVFVIRIRGTSDCFGFV